MLSNEEKFFNGFWLLIYVCMYVYWEEMNDNAGNINVSMYMNIV